MAMAGATAYILRLTPQPLRVMVDVSSTALRNFKGFHIGSDPIFVALL